MHTGHGKRKRAEEILIRLGKREELYYIPDPLEDQLVRRLKAFRKTGKMIGKLSAMRYAGKAGDQGILLDYLFGLTLWQLTAYEKSLSRLEQEKEDYMELYRLIGITDAAISILSFRQSLPFYTEPKFHEKKELMMEELYHPLLKDPVTNSMQWKNNCIITGSNASGKSTWIKAVGINAVMAQTILTCTARSCSMIKGTVMSSMAVKDDVLSGDSYFMKEVKYLKRMLLSLSEDRMTICIIDEILKGTNTEERLAASSAVLQYMAQQNCLVMVATHDHELTVMLKGNYENYHFTEQIRRR